MILKNFFTNLFKKIFNKQTNDDSKSVNTITSNNSNIIIEVSEVTSDKPKKVVTNLKVNNDFFNKIKPSSILWVKMPNYVKIKHEEKPHDERPYVVINVDHNNKELNGFYTTSNGENATLCNKKYKKYKYVISNKKYKLTKPSFVEFYYCATLSFKDVIHVLDNLDSKDYKLMLKKVNLFRNKKVISNGQNMILEIGDIIIDNDQLYLIFQHDYQYSYALKIFKTNMSNFNINDNPNCFKSEGIIYGVDFDETIILNNIDEFVIKDIILEEQLKPILEKRKEYKFKKKHGDIDHRKIKRKKKK